MLGKLYVSDLKRAFSYRWLRLHRSSGFSGERKNKLKILVIFYAQATTDPGMIVENSNPKTFQITNGLYYT